MADKQSVSGHAVDPSMEAPAPPAALRNPAPLAGRPANPGAGVRRAATVQWTVGRDSPLAATGPSTDCLSATTGQLEACRLHLGALLSIALVVLAACSDGGGARSDAGVGVVAASFVGGAACASCHEAQYSDWVRSHHALAMQLPDEGSVLGDFSGVRFERGGRFFEFGRRDEDYVVRTDDLEEADVRELRVAYTFGAEPLQQYLLQMPAGRLQALTVAWDSRPREAGGQRWFDLAEGEIEAGDALHWAGTFYTWNGRCADCHSTNLEKGYIVAEDRFETSYSSVNVDCEACHGSGSAHASNPQTPLLLSGVDRAWTFEPGSSIASLAGGIDPAADSTVSPAAEIAQCAACHSRRMELGDSVPGEPMLEAYVPAVLSEGLYHADGQIDDEVFVYGSFVQSAMYAAGVGCVDCHDPHTAGLLREGNALCGSCHLPTVYDTPEHHFHESATGGSQCVACHMPAKTYMRVDPRRDHSFRVPRPDLSVAIGTPNVCNDCHADQSAQWAADTIADWTGGATPEPHFALALEAGRRWSADRGERLRDLLMNSQEPAIARATALELMSRQFDNAATALLEELLRSKESLVQLAALRSVEFVAPERRRALAQRFLDHPLLAFRIESARVLIPVRDELGEARRRDFDAALAEYLDVQTYNGETAEARVNLASVHAEYGRFDEAEAALRAAMEANPEFAPAYVNLADLYRLLNRDEQGLQLLMSAEQDFEFEEASIASAIGFSLARLDRADESVAWFELAKARAPNDPYHAYLHGVSLNSTAGGTAGIDELVAAHERFPGYSPILFALATMSRDAGEIERAFGYAQSLLAIDPADVQARSLVDELRRLRQQ